MSDESQRPGAPLLEVESADRWVAGKTRDELLTDLKAYLGRLRDNPHSIVDRLHVAAIQLRLGREQEALIHYEGVLRGYVGEGQILSAIALCQRILAIYPRLPRIQRILAALYARAPRESGVPHPVTPIEGAEEQVTTTFLSGVGESDGPTDGQFGQPESRSPAERYRRDLFDAGDDLRPTMPYQQQLRPPSAPHGPLPAQPAKSPFAVEPAGDQEEVVLLTRPKRKP